MCLSVVCCAYVYGLTSDFYENDRIFGENNRHIFQELKNRIKLNLPGPTGG